MHYKLNSATRKKKSLYKTIQFGKIKFTIKIKNYSYLYKLFRKILSTLIDFD